MCRVQLSVPSERSPALTASWLCSSFMAAWPCSISAAPSLTSALRPSGGGMLITGMRHAGGPQLLGPALVQLLLMLLRRQETAAVEAGVTFAAAHATGGVSDKTCLS